MGTFLNQARAALNRQVDDWNAASERIILNVQNQLELDENARELKKDDAVEGVAFFAMSRVATTVCNAVAIVAKASPIHDLSDGDKALFEIAKFLRMAPDGRAAKHLDHFLNGTGTPVQFGTHQLLSEDLGVRELVLQHLKQALPADAPWRSESGEIPIVKPNFRNTDWYLAIGSFVFEWKLHGKSADGKHVYVMISGSNEYKWHPFANRFARCLHVAGDALTKSSGDKPPIAKNFTMIADPALIDVRSNTIAPALSAPSM